ncbi:hypothetical protein T03_10332 [Trichinella britovi]|uniref:Uncharacterized protein n=1 Tax=Trichinella britovi TaxID=45882 RepID=A0A0V1C4R7_TRIBR|nr:hypothetical protein T03_10332 [Trichinella britovi]
MCYQSIIGRDRIPRSTQIQIAKETIKGTCLPTSSAMKASQCIQTLYMLRK